MGGLVLSGGLVVGVSCFGCFGDCVVLPRCFRLLWVGII